MAATLAPFGRTLAGLMLLGLARQAAALGLAQQRSRRIADAARPFESDPDAACAQVLLLGDSTGVGVGAPCPAQTLPGLIAQAFPQVRIVNRCRNGARVADALAQLRALDAAALPAGGHDLVLVCAGGNDVLRHTRTAVLAEAATALLSELRGRARQVVWLGCGNLGSTPVMHRPLAWWACRRTGSTMHLLQRIAQEHGAEFIDFYRPRRDDPFAREPQRWFALDGVHPSAATYRHSYEVLAARVPLDALLGGTRPSTTPCQENAP